MNILGISCYYHDAAAAIIKDDKIVAACEEERFSRIKHDNNFPINAVKYCLSEANISLSQLDYIVFYEKPILKFERIIQTAVETFPKSFGVFISSVPPFISEKLDMRKVIRKKLKYNGKILFTTHHTSHSASCFLASPFKRAAILTVDGVGEWETTRISIGEGTKITPIKSIHFPNSLGLFYGAVTTFLGFRVNNDEFKVMGLAAYGKPKYLNKFKRVIIQNPDGSFKLNMRYFSFRESQSMFSKKFIDEFGIPRKKDEKILEYHKDIAASLQRITEEVLLGLAKEAKRITNLPNLCMAGGVALNCVANTRIIREASFKHIYVQPAAGDSGGALGAALQVLAITTDKKEQMTHAYLGPSFLNSEIENILKQNKARYKSYPRKELLQKTARLIAKNKIIGWFQGRMEFGPRALGNRSILANPCHPKMKDILNKKVKHREEFRPFAPAVLKEEAHKYFNLYKEDEFMLFVADVKKEKQNLLPSITHVDGTARLQIVSKTKNPLFYDLIKEFKKITKVPIVINTSFNVRGEPIVCTPQDAFNCFKGTGIDYLVIGDFIVKK